MKIKLNIYGIANSFYKNAKRVPAKQLKDEYFRLFDESQLQVKWEEEYKKAKEYGDVNGMLIEEIKLKILKEVKSKFLDIMQEAKCDE